MIVDGKRLNENQRMALLRAEEFEALGMTDVMEVTHDSLRVVRMVAHSTLAPPPSGAGAAQTATSSHADREQAQAADESQRDVYGVPALA